MHEEIERTETKRKSWIKNINLLWIGVLREEEEGKLKLANQNSLFEYLFTDLNINYYKYSIHLDFTGFWGLLEDKDQEGNLIEMMIYKKITLKKSLMKIVI